MAVESNIPYVANLVNSIIGVSVLAMPFCMKKCGLVLGLSLLLGAAWLTYISCSMLVSAAVQKRRRTYEYLALYTVGTVGKFAVELSMIGLMLGTCVAFYVVIGDLATGILAGYVESEIHKLRTFVIIFCAVCIALPLGLMKNLTALGRIGIFSLVFYMLFVFVMLFNSINSGMLTFDWLEKVELFRPAGVFQCLPIFSLAYACQCQLFVVYDSLEDPSILRMDKIVTTSLKIVTTVYCLVAIFGYATFTDDVYGNVLQNFKSSVVLQFIKLGFAVSVVVGFPLMIFPCRQSIHTLFFSQQPKDGTPSKTYIEPFTFKAITLCIVISTMSIAILIPNVETILGLTGATMGSFICFIFPAIIFSKASPKGDTTISKFVFGIGCLLLIVCTYSNVYIASADNIAVKPPVVAPEKNSPLGGVNLDENPALDARDHEDVIPLPTKPPIAEVVGDEHRHEPANPMEPILGDGGEDSPIQEEEKKGPEDPGEKVQEEQKGEEVQPDSEDGGKVDPVLEEPPDSLGHPDLEEAEKSQEADDKVKEEVEPNIERPESPVLDKKDTKENPKDQQELNKKIEDKEKNIEDKVKEIEDKVKEPGAVDDSKPVDNSDNFDKESELKNQELLDKIKEQHKKQHELLKEQEELIQALEEVGGKNENKIDDGGQENVPAEKNSQEEKILAKNDENLAQNDDVKVSEPKEPQKEVEIKKQPSVLDSAKQPEPIINRPVENPLEEEEQLLKGGDEKVLDTDRLEREAGKVMEKKDNSPQKEPVIMSDGIQNDEKIVEKFDAKNPIEFDQQQNPNLQNENEDKLKLPVDNPPLGGDSEEQQNFAEDEINHGNAAAEKQELNAENDAEKIDENEIIEGNEKMPKARDLKSVLLDEKVEKVVL